MSQFDKLYTSREKLVKTVMDLTENVNRISGEVNTKQDTLVSGESIKTVNGESLLGSGGLAISGETLVVDETPTSGSDNLVKSGGVKEELALGSVYDVSAHNSGTTFASLSALLSSQSLSSLIPTAVRKGGMSIKFVLTSDNNYVQYMYKVTDAATAATFTNVDNWEKMNLEKEVGLLEAKVDGAISYNVLQTQLLDIAGALPDTRAAGSYGADINSTYLSSGWTAFPPYYFKKTGVKHILSTNYDGATGVLLGYKKSGNNYVRETSVGMANWTTVGNEKQIELPANIVAIRFEIASASLSDSLYIHSTDETYTDVHIKENALPQLNPWIGKKICGIGDSIMIGCYDSDGGGHTKGDAILDGETGSSYGFEINSTGGFLGALRAKYQDVDILNMGVGSTTMARNDSVVPNLNYKCITDRIDNIPQEGYDYILLMGGCNDFFHKDTYSISYGTESNIEYLPLVADYDTDTQQYAANSFRLYPFSGAGNQDLDITTFCGAMEIALIKLLVRFKDRKLGYVIPHAIRPTTEMNKYMDYAKSLCKKYGIPCLDLRELAMMPRVLSIAGGTGTYNSMYTLDAVHPNTLGYQKRYLPAFEAFLRTL